MRIITAALLASATLAAAPALADETWKTDLGKVIWEKDYAGGAIFSVEVSKGKVTRFYIEGLTASDEARSFYNGFWIAEGEDNLCPATLTGPDGTKSKTWGRLEISFVKKGFPSDWIMRTGDCMEPLTDTLSGIAPK